VKSNAFDVEIALRARGRAAVRSTRLSMSWSTISFHEQPAHRTRKEPSKKMAFVFKRRVGGMTGSLIEAARSVPKRHGK